jgi:hypothetical protein
MIAPQELRATRVLVAADTAGGVARLAVLRGSRELQRRFRGCDRINQCKTSDERYLEDLGADAPALICHWTRCRSRPVRHMDPERATWSTGR